MSSTDELSKVPKAKRRQNRSCDQCRAGKRRCDVELQDSSIFSACSNCKKWRKECTIEWLRSREERRADHQRSELLQTTPLDQDDVHLPTFPPSWTATGPGPPTYCSDSFFGADLTTSHSASSTWTGPLSWSSGSPGPQVERELSSFAGQYLPSDGLDASSTGLVSDTISGALGVKNASDLAVLNAAGSTSTPDFDQWTRSISRDICTDLCSPWEANDDFMLSLEASISLQTASDTTVRGNKRRRQAAIDDEGPEYEQRILGLDVLSDPSLINLQTGFFRSPTPLTSHMLSEDFNRMQIKSTLLKVYHDSLEGALSCWLTERNCPYSVSTFEDQNVWSRSWMNRIFARTTALDNAYAEAGLLSTRDQKQAAKVLNAVVMAFSAQWSRPARMHEIGVDSFGRGVQKSLWYKAKAALYEACENMSFKVIFAGIIFSLTQRPVESLDQDNNAANTSEDKLSGLFKLLDLDGPTLSLDAALRKLHDHRRHLRQVKHLHGGARKAPAQLSTENLETFNLLYWLAIMFDTLSATMNRRPFTIGDADSHIGRENIDVIKSLLHSTGSCDGTQSPDKDDNITNLWGSFFLHRRSHLGDTRKQSTRWPCSYLDAAACLADAAPVKVLLYRRVGHLQSLFYQEASSQDIEGGLEAVLEVYNYWNDSYGLFINDCLKHHEALPVRVQSWYTLLAAHWNLAVLILADLIETLQHAGMIIQHTIGLTALIRKRAVDQISDLGYHARHTTEPSAFAQSPDFHHAVNEAALLTEPWTVVLIRAFSLAGAVLANRVASEGSKGDACVEVCSESKLRLQWCIDALVLLGRKSDMAMRAAGALRRAAS